MTLQQAQRQYPDAIQAKMTHKANAFTHEDLVEAAKWFGRPQEVEILFAHVGKTVSRVIYSAQAFKEKQTSNK